MSEWNSEQYLKFKAQRTQPAVDLVRRINLESPKEVLDIGCGPGNSTKVLRDAFPAAHIVGIDNSEDMIRKAQGSHPDMEFKLMSVDEICQGDEEYDVLFSNACLQWVPDHGTLIPKLYERLKPGGVLAVQVPINAEEPLYQIIVETVNEWTFNAAPQNPNMALSGVEYFDILSGLTSQFDIWETVYYHSMPSVDAMIEWVKGSRLLPYLQALDEEGGERLIRTITEKAIKVYHPQKNGETIFRFRRLFFTVTK